MCQLSDGYTLAIVRVDHPEAGVVRPKYPPCKGDPTGSGFCTNTQCEVKCQTAGPYVCEEGGAQVRCWMPCRHQRGLAPFEPRVMGHHLRCADLAGRGSRKPEKGEFGIDGRPRSDRSNKHSTCP